ncbi:MAG: hypothetical protein KatS3mg051_0989 [Anaerolineae bacterium]|nr:MAG: hypothetical protein KatS3mg051_0989 [Anaerolineae bacterium]
MILIAPSHLLGGLWGLVFAAPWAWWLIPPSRRTGITLAVMTLALSLGTLTLGMLALTWVGALETEAVLGGTVAVCSAGLMVAWRAGLRLAGRRLDVPHMRSHPVASGAALIILGLAALIVLEAVYWPFSGDDAVSIYANHSRRIFQARALPGGEGLYEAYPMLLPFSHVYTYLLAGRVQEYLARVAVAALALGTLGATFALGRALYGWRAGLAAATLLALTPAFTRWAAAGYTDIPAGFFVALAALAGWWLAEGRSGRTAWLFGALTGLAAWTKNSALAVCLSALIWAIYLGWRRALRWREIALVAAGLAMMAGPWYAHTLLEFGRLVPPTVWAERARHTLGALVPFLSEPREYFAPGIAVTVGMGWAAVEAWRGHSAGERARLLWIMAGPFAIAWWWAASYETRFLLTIYPLFCVMGARALMRVWETWRGERLLRPAYGLVLAALLVALALPAARKALSYKGALLRDPLMDDTVRHQQVLGSIYDVALYLRALSATGTVLTDDYFLPFYAAQEGQLQVVVGGLPDRAALSRYDYLVVRTGSPLLRVAEAGDLTRLTTIGRYDVYRVHVR